MSAGTIGVGREGRPHHAILTRYSVSSQLYGMRSGQCWETQELYMDATTLTRTEFPVGPS